MERADVYLSRSGWFSSRERARAAIAEGAVTIDGEVVKKPSKPIDDEKEHDVRIGAGVCLYASRGGLKLESAIERQRHLGLAFLGVEELFFLGVVDETQFNEDARHGGLPKHEESGLLHATVVAPHLLGELLLHFGGKIEALFLIHAL